MLYKNSLLTYTDERSNKYQLYDGICILATVFYFVSMNSLTLVYKGNNSIGYTIRNNTHTDVQTSTWHTLHYYTCEGSSGFSKGENNEGTTRVAEGEAGNCLFRKRRRRTDYTHVPYTMWKSYNEFKSKLIVNPNPIPKEVPSLPTPLYV